MAATRAVAPPAGQEARPWAPRLAAAGLAAVGAAVLAILVVQYLRVGADWPAQDFRAFEARHWHVWSDKWYGGSALPGYSVLYPLAAAFVGASATGVVAVAAATFFAVLLLADRPRPELATCAAAVAVSLLGGLVIGQVTFLLGVPFALAGLLCALHRRAAAAAGLAALASLASPLVGFFLLVLGVSTVRSWGWRRSVWTVPAGLGSLVALVVDSGGGPYTYRAQSLLTITLFCAGTWLAAGRSRRVLRDFAAVYLVVSALLFLVDNPVGGNAGRLGKDVVLPLLVLELARRLRTGVRPPIRTAIALGIATVLGTWWAVQPVVAAYRFGADDPGRSSGYYRGLLQFLRTQDPARGRLEIPFTRTHTEASAVGTKFPLARGWERQVDLGLNDLLYHRLSAQRYRHWLDDNAVRLIAVADLEPDIGGINEVRLLRHPPPYLTRVWSDRHWTVWAVSRPAPMVTGPAMLVRIGEASVVLRFARPGTALVRVTSSPFWTVARSDGAAVELRRSSGGWLEVHSDRRGTVLLRARLNLRVLNPWSPLR